MPTDGATIWTRTSVMRYQQSLSE